MRSAKRHRTKEPMGVRVMGNPAGRILVMLLVATAILSRPAGLKKETVSRIEPAPPRVVFEEGEPLSLHIPAIELQTGLGLAGLHQGRLDSSGLKKSPVLISPAARSSLCRIGAIGVGLILGHRQWKQKPLVFARLNELEKGDTVVVAGRDRTVTFEVYRKATVKPAEIWPVVDEENDRCLQRRRPVIILVTCAPYGFNWRRLLVFAAHRDM